MINKRIFALMGKSKKYVWMNVVFQWLSEGLNIGMMAVLSIFIANLFEKRLHANDFGILGMSISIVLFLRYLCIQAAGRMSFLSSKEVKVSLRELIYQKMLDLGASYKEKTETSKVMAVAVEGVDQLKTYFGSYLPQFFYAMLVPLTLFAVVSLISLKSAAILFICVPLIPISIAAVQTWAKKLLAKYWGEYSSLKDTFLENLQGLTTLKIYQADEYKNKKMNEEAEKFRQITMKVLYMQLNSITIMDLVAYGGTALGIIMAVCQFQDGMISLKGCLFIILISADFFIPMRLLGSYFHIAMNGVAASETIFYLLDLEVEDSVSEEVKDDYTIECENLSFSYENDQDVIQHVNMKIPMGSFVSIVGKSGCGKSTLSSILMGKYKNVQGLVKIGDTQLNNLSEKSLMETITYVSFQSYVFKGTVRENLLMGNPSASDQDLWHAIEQVNLKDFLKSENGLETFLMERGSNLSGGQRQRLCLARALLHESKIYIFDEATSNIDVESENDIMQIIHQLAKIKTVVLISHRLANVIDSDVIYVMDEGRIVESGNHQQLLDLKGSYYELWQSQQSLENYGKE